MTDRVETGWAVFDAALSGGFPRGGITEVSGPAGAGRPELFVRCLRDFPGRVLLISLERDVHRLTKWPLAAVKLGRAILRGGYDIIILDGITNELAGFKGWPRLGRWLQRSNTALVLGTHREAEQAPAYLTHLQLRCVRSAGEPLTILMTKNVISVSPILGVPLIKTNVYPTVLPQ